MVEFVKMHSCGNDYIYIDCTAKPMVQWPKERIADLCDRHFGIGGDGVVFITKQNNYRMTMYNADGTRGKICGNALRCIAHYLYKTYCAVFPLSIDTDVGTRTVERVDGKYRVDMGRAEWLKKTIVDDVLCDIVSIGNLHAVCMTDKSADEIAEHIRGAVAPVALNVESYRVVEQNAIAMTVNENGTGRTLACGSGACAAAFASCKAGNCTYCIPIKVKMEGGEVNVECLHDGQVYLCGDAHIVYRGVADD